MMDKLVLYQGLFYEGDSQDLRAIYPVPVISRVSCPFIAPIGMDEVIFREDSFDPVTRIRRGRLYLGGRRVESWSSSRIDDGFYRSYKPYGQATHGNNWNPDASYDAWQANNVSPEDVKGHIIQIGVDRFVTPWCIVGVERIAIGHILLTLRANSLLGIIPELADVIIDKDGNAVNARPVQASLDLLVEAFHRQQPIPIVDTARETARVILRWWWGDEVEQDDLFDAIKVIPADQCTLQWASKILARLHPRGKSSEQERQAAKGKLLRSVVEEDAHCAAELVGLLLREIGWAQPRVSF